MPRISQFYGIVITMYYRDHQPPHFHARYAEYKAEYTIAERSRLVGSLPHRAEALVREWAALHEAELYANWERCRQQAPLAPIAPLD
jgi:hypothetical protein